MQVKGRGHVLGDQPTDRKRRLLPARKEHGLCWCHRPVGTGRAGG